MHGGPRRCVAGLQTRPLAPSNHRRCPRLMQGGCEDEHVRMGFYERELFDKMHGEDEWVALLPARCACSAHPAPCDVPSDPTPCLPACLPARGAWPAQHGLPACGPCLLMWHRASLPLSLPPPPCRMAVDKLKEGIDNFAGGAAPQSQRRMCTPLHPALPMPLPPAPAAAVVRSAFQPAMWSWQGAVWQPPQTARALLAGS